MRDENTPWKRKIKYQRVDIDNKLCFSKTSWEERWMMQTLSSSGSKRWINSDGDSLCYVDIPKMAYSSLSENHLATNTVSEISTTLLKELNHERLTDVMRDFALWHTTPTFSCQSWSITTRTTSSARKLSQTLNAEETWRFSPTGWKHIIEFDRMKSWNRSMLSAVFRAKGIA